MCFRVAVGGERAESEQISQSAVDVKSLVAPGSGRVVISGDPLSLAVLCMCASVCLTPFVLECGVEDVCLHMIACIYVSAGACV